MRTIAKADRNQPDIVKALRSMGAVVKHTHQLKNLFDILVFFRGQTYCVEIKDGLKPPSGQKLKDGELQCKLDLESVGVTYWVINSVEQALQMINV